MRKERAQEFRGGDCLGDSIVEVFAPRGKGVEINSKIFHLI